jgi:glycosyltransferase involved in cell wall biosynthesis
MLRHLKANSYEVLHHHGLWLRTLHYAHRHARTCSIPYVISPRGMMSSWAWNHHRRRKQLANILVHPKALQNATGWHATSQQEADDIRRLGFRQPICVSPNGVEVPTDQQLQIAREFWLDRVPELKDYQVALFYSRLHSKKRIVELLDLWRAQAPDGWMLLVVGIPDQFSVEQLEDQILREGGKQPIRVLDGTYQPPPYSVADLLLLPSHSENFGLVIAEALVAGTPVLTTDTTPWAELNERNAGWCVPYADYDRLLQAALAESSATLSRRGALGRKWVKAEFAWEVVAERLSGFYRELHRSHN